MINLPEDVAQYFKQQGKRGGQTRAKNLTKQQRREIAQKAARARWDKKKGKQ